MTIERSRKGRTAAATTLSGLMIATMSLGAATAANADVEGSPEEPVTADQLDFEVSSLTLVRSPQVAIAGEETELVVVGYNEDGSEGAVLDPSMYEVITDNYDGTEEEGNDVIDGNVVTFNDVPEDEVIERTVTVSYEGGITSEWTMRVAPDVETAIGIGVVVEFDEESYHGYAPPMTAGDSFDVSADGPFHFGEDVNIYLGDQLVGETVAEYDGKVNNASVTIPEGTNPGVHMLRLVGVDSEQESSVEIETFSTDLWVDAEEIVPGQDFAVHGSGFYANEDISFEMIGDFPEPISADTTADENGVFDLQFNIPTQTEPGIYVARATGADSDRTSTIGFNVTDSNLEIVDPEDIEDEEDPVEEYGFDGFRTGTLGSSADGETLDLNITPTIDGEDTDADINPEDFTVVSSGAEDEVDGLSVTFNGEGDRVLTITHNESGESITRELNVAASDDADEGDDGDDDADNGNGGEDDADNGDEGDNGDGGDNGSGEEDELVEVSPEEPTMTDNVVSIPETEGVVYVAGNTGDVLTGEVDLDELDVTGLHVTAEVEEGYEFAEDVETDWSFERVDEEDDAGDDVVEVAPESPTFNEEDNTVSVPETEGVVYTVDGEAVEGTVDVPEDGLTVDAELVEGYEFAEDADTSWNFEHVPEDSDTETREAEVTLPESEVEAGDEVQFSVTGLLEGDNVTVSLNPELDSFTANSEGVVEDVVTIPEDTEEGTHELSFTSEDFDLDETVEIEVLAASDEGNGDDGEDGEGEDVSYITPDSPTHNEADNTVDIPETEGVVYTVDGETVEGTVDVLAEGITVNAETTEGYAFEDDVEASWDYSYVLGDDEDADTDPDSPVADDNDFDGPGDSATTPGDIDGDESDAGPSGGEAGSGSNDGPAGPSGGSAGPAGPERVGPGEDDMTPASDTSGESADTATINTGFIDENPGVGIGLAALALGGLAAAAIGAQRLVARRNS